MVHSLDRFHVDYRLWVICIDEDAAAIVEEAGNARLAPLRREAWEVMSLLALRDVRTLQEYCWTLTPFAVSYVFENFEDVETLFYVDADVWFVRDPSSYLDQVASQIKGAFITEHAFPAELKSLEKFGVFNVQLVGFHRIGGRDILEGWMGQCLEWCSVKLEDGKYGDQKYLDEWPAIHAGRIAIGRPMSFFQGPWNVLSFAPSWALTFHFSGLKLLNNKYVQLAHPNFRLSQEHIWEIYVPYLRDLLQAEMFVNKKLPSVRRAFREFLLAGVLSARRLLTLDITMYLSPSKLRERNIMKLSQLDGSTRR